MNWFLSKKFRISLMIVICLSVGSLAYFSFDRLQLSKEVQGAIVGSTAGGSSANGSWLKSLGENLGLIGSALASILSTITLLISKRKEWARDKLDMKRLDIEQAKLELELAELRRKISSTQS